MAAGGRRRTAERGRTLLDDRFFDRSVHDVARDLIGCELVHGRTAGVIVEAESYHADDEACHAFNGPTQRNRVLFGPPGHAYVYLSYGIHSCLNFVCEPHGQAAAVLIRALAPTRGLALMRARRGTEAPAGLCSGPGKLTQALGIGLELNGVALCGGPLRVYARDGEWADPEIVAGPRVGITRAVELPWRFCAAGSVFVSRPRPR